MIFRSHCLIGALGDTHTATAHIIGCDGSSIVEAINSTTYRYSYNCDFPSCASCVDSEVLTVGVCGHALVTSTLCLGGLDDQVPSGISYVQTGLRCDMSQGAVVVNMGNSSTCQPFNGVSYGQVGLEMIISVFFDIAMNRVTWSRCMLIFTWQISDNGDGTYDVRLQCLGSRGQCVQCGYENVAALPNVCYDLNSDDDGFDVSWMLV